VTEAGRAREPRHRRGLDDHDEHEYEYERGVPMSDHESSTDTRTTATGTNPEGPKKRSFVEEIEVSGSNLVERFKELVQEGNTRRVTIRTQEGYELMTVPLTFGVVAGGLVAWASPILAALGALAGIVSRVKLEVLREEGDDPPRA
jgi:hypothetical protein